MPLKTLLRGLVAATIACAFAAPSFAGLFSVTPVRIFMSPRDRATAVTITNESDEELVMQADVFEWRQKPGGEDDLVPSEDLVLSPPILKLPARGRQVVRLAMMKPLAAGTRQATYRMVLREIPEAKKDAQKVELQVALAFSLPVFITPPQAKRDFRCELKRQAADTVRVACENTGDTYVQPREFTLASDGGPKVASRDNAAYILPGMQRGTDLRRADGPIPAGKYKLDVALDDGSSRSFELALPD